MKIVLSSFGSSGDFNPCLGLGRALRAKGVDVIFLSNPYYEQKITDAGLRFAAAGEYFDVFQEIADNPDYLHPRKGPRAVWKMVLKTVPVMYHAMKEVIETEAPDMVASHILEFGGMTAAIEKSVPYTVLCPNPMSWFGSNPPGYMNFTELPLWLRRFQAKLMHGVMNVAFQHSLGPLCRKQGIPAPFETVGQVFEKAALNLGFWSALLKDSAADDPPNGKICGFVRDQHVCDWDDVPEAIQRLFDGDRKPVVAGLGSTASLHGEAIYRCTADVCKQLEYPCLLVGKDLGRYADPDRAILAVDFAPYGWVFPRAAIVIHHGGLNTTAETLRAGVPALIVPHGYDQFDNAIRTAHLGLSKRIQPGRVTAHRLMPIIRSILEDARMHDRAKQFAAELKFRPDGIAVAVDHLIRATEKL